ncbi:MAG: hypothetical protein AAF206_12310 [Bacteroidota bacterium]
MKQIRCVLACTLLLIQCGLHAQTVIISDADVQAPTLQRRTPAYKQVRQIDTLIISAINPFFDDFSYPGTMPDTNLWFVSENNFDAPLVNRNQAIDPPTQGVVSFDGVSRFNVPYEIDALSRGLADQLVSHYIDLSGFDANDDLFLSFFLQSQGRGDRPESTDSFLVKVFLPDSNQEFTLFSDSGTPQGPFTQYILPIKQADFFQTRFQLIFESRGSQNGALDHWHLDYVYLGPNRNNLDLFYDDISPSQVLSSPLAPYTAVPRFHLNPSDVPMQSVAVSYSNLDNAAVSTQAEAGISDPIGGNSFSGTTQQSNALNLSSTQFASVSFSAFDDQNFATNGVIELTASIPNGADSRPENNQLRTEFRVDSIFAYDDGEADAGFGLNQGFGFGSEFVFDRPDSLIAVWMSFVPTVNYNPVTTQTTYMDGKSFRLAVWKDPHPDSLLLQQVAGMQVRYGSEPNTFFRYPLTDPLGVDGQVWIGVQQINADPLGIGFDFTNDNGSRTYWDSSGVWVQTGIAGTLMIRPEMQNGEPPVASLDPSLLEIATQIKLYPNPVRIGHELEVDLSRLRSWETYTGELVSIEGQRMMRHVETNLRSLFAVSIPSNIPPGLYVWIHRIQRRDGRILVDAEKILIQ